MTLHLAAALGTIFMDILVLKYNTSSIPVQDNIVRGFLLVLIGQSVHGLNSSHDGSLLEVKEFKLEVVVSDLAVSYRLIK